MHSVDLLGNSPAIIHHVITPIITTNHKRATSRKGAFTFDELRKPL